MITKSFPDRQQRSALWKEAFGDPEAFIDLFFRTGYHPEWCAFHMEGEELAAILYWLDCEVDGRKLAYIYAVATAKAFQGRGFCRKLMDNTHRKLRDMGYEGTILVPGSKELFQMYGKMGYSICSHIREITCEAAKEPAQIRRLTAAEYAALRRTYLGAGGVIQEGENLTYLAEQASLYGGSDFVAAVVVDGEKLYCPELLGNERAAAGIVKALGKERGTFRMPGDEKPFAMYHSLNGSEAPTYFGLAFD